MSYEDIQQEIWKDIPEYENYYQASNLGRIRSIDRQVFMSCADGRSFWYNRKGKIREPFDNRGYWNICLNKSKAEKTFAVHRLVATTFIPNPDNLPQVNHKDGNKKNNKVENLEWCTASENTKHAVDIGLINTDFLRKISMKGAEKQSRRICCIDSGEVFKSVYEAIRRLKTDSVRTAINSKENVTHQGFGFHVKQITEEEYQRALDAQLSYEEYDAIYIDIQNRIDYFMNNRIWRTSGYVKDIHRFDKEVI